MAPDTSTFVRANGIDIHCRESGKGPPLLLLHGGVVSSDPIWAGHPFAYVSHMARLAEHFRVIAPDTRGCSKTIHSGGGTITFDMLADDIIALIGALGLERPAICGFSEGAITATIVAIRSPNAVRAVVNDAGYDMFNPEAPTFRMMRQTLGGGPDATVADPEAASRFFAASPEMRATFALMQKDQPDWKMYLRDAFHRTTRSPGYTFDDLAAITAPTLILTGDRDHFCSAEDAITAYRRLPSGELAILPNVGHTLPPGKIEASIEFLLRRIRG